MDLFSAKFVDRIGLPGLPFWQPISALLSGLIFLTILPDLLSDSFIGILISVMIYAVGGGLIEVLISPIMESCPTDNKEQAMSLLHSFYCWGHMGVVLISTIFFKLAGISNWKLLALIWAIVPILNTLVFARTPIAPIIEEGETGLTMKQLFSMKIFWILFLMMLSAGASEQAVSQWASTFAERGLGVSKTVGDLAGPMSFALLMESPDILSFFRRGRIRQGGPDYSSEPPYRPPPMPFARIGGDPEYLTR